MEAAAPGATPSATEVPTVARADASAYTSFVADMAARSEAQTLQVDGLVAPTTETQPAIEGL